MFVCLRPGAVIGGDNQQYPVDRQDSGQHVRQKPLVTGDIDEPDLQAIDVPVGEPEVDGDPAALLFGKTIAVDSGDGTHECGLAVIDVSRGSDDPTHGVTSDE